MIFVSYILFVLVFLMWRERVPTFERTFERSFERGRQVSYIHQVQKNASTEPVIIVTINICIGSWALRIFPSRVSPIVISAHVALIIRVQNFQYLPRTLPRCGFQPWNLSALSRPFSTLELPSYDMIYAVQYVT